MAKRKIEKLWHRKQGSGNNLNRNGHSKKVQNKNSTQWVVNISSIPLTNAQETLLSHGPNFTIALRIPYKEYITVIEVACKSFKPPDVEEVRADISWILRQSEPLKPNLTREEWKDIKQLESDKDCIVVTADKGVAVVVMDRNEYIKKMKNLLEDTITYSPLSMDPTNN